MVNQFGRAAVTGDFAELDNNVREVTLRAEDQSGINPVTTTVEFLYKDTSNNNIYIIGEGTRAERTNAAGEIVVGFEYTYRSQDPFRTITADQLTRVYDAVPRRAKSQEIAGGRLVYGNYLQNYDLPAAFDFEATSDFGAVDTNLPNHSVKTRRTYQVGVVLADEFGRTSPVILSSSGRDTVFLGGTADQRPQHLSLNFSTTAGIRTTFPDWAHSYRIVVKQREQEYYNAVFTVPAGGGMTPRSGDNVNKIPIDQTTIADTGASFRPSSEKIYINFDGNEQVDNDTLFTPEGINGMGQLSLSNIPVTAGQNVIFETEPVTSELDIFFETSTGGLVADLPDNNTIAVNFANCYIQVAEDRTGRNPIRLEVNRIRAGFNEPFFDVGVRAHVVIENFSGEERRSATLIHSSGLFNSRTNVNQLNQFNESEGGLTINLDPSDGSIQKLFAEDTQLLIWQEDKVSRSPVDKDFIYSAEGGQVPVTSNTQFLGTIAPYAGEYGISRDPASFAVYGTRKYFTDKNRGVVLRLSQDGLSEISGAGMNDFFRDALKTSSTIIGSFNEYHDTYNLTIVGNGYPGNEDTNIATVRENARFNADNRAAIAAGNVNARDIDYFTVSFEEDVKGWKSFSSYKQESGLTLNNTYYTFSGGNLWEHSLNQTRNNFYGVQYSSLLELIFNDAPSVIKEYKTLATEGTPGWECTQLDTDIESFGEDLETLETEQFTLNFVSLATFGGNTQVPSRSINSVTEGSTTNFIVTFTPNDGFEFTDASQIQMSVADDNIADNFVIAAFDSTGAQTNAGDTEQEVIGGNIVSVIRHTPPAGLLPNNAAVINIDGIGPGQQVIGGQYSITLNVISGDTIDAQAWETRDGNAGTATITIDGSYFNHGGQTSDVTYGIQANKTVDADGVLDISDDTNYFPYTGTPIAYDDSTGVVIQDVGTIGYPANLRQHIINGSVSFEYGDNTDIPNTFMFSGNGGDPNRNDLFVTQQFNLPELGQSGTLALPAGSDLPRYPRINFELISEPAAGVFESGPTDVDRLFFSRYIRFNDTPFDARQPRTTDLITGSDSHLDPLVESNDAYETPSDTSWQEANLPQTFPIPTDDRNVGSDPRSTGGTVVLEFGATDETHHIPAPATVDSAPAGWRIQDNGPAGFWDGIWNYQFVQSRLVATRDFNGGIITADTTISIRLNGHPTTPAMPFELTWSTMNTGNIVAPTAARPVEQLEITNHVVGDQEIIVDVDSQHYYGIFGGRRLDNILPTVNTLTPASTLHMDNIEPNDANTQPYFAPIGTPAAPLYNQITGTDRVYLMPVGGEARRQGPADADYDSLRNLTHSPNTTITGTGNDLVTSTVGYGMYRIPEIGTATQGHVVWLRQEFNDGFQQGGIPLLSAEAQGFYHHDTDSVTILAPYNPYPFPRATLIHGLNAANHTFDTIIQGLGSRDTVDLATAAVDGHRVLSIHQVGVPTDPVPPHYNFEGANMEAMRMTQFRMAVTSRYRGITTMGGSDNDTMRWNTDIEGGLPVYGDIPDVAHAPFFGDHPTNDGVGSIAGSYLRRNISEPVTNADNVTGLNTRDLFMPSLQFGHLFYQGNRNGDRDLAGRDRENPIDPTGAAGLPANFSAEAGHNLNSAAASMLQSFGNEERFGIQAVYDFKNVNNSDMTTNATDRALPFPVRMEFEIDRRSINQDNLASMIFGNFIYNTNNINYYAPWFFRQLSGTQLRRDQGQTYTQGNNEGIPVTNIRRIPQANRANTVIIELEIPIFSNNIASVHAIEFLLANGNLSHINAQTNAGQFQVGQFDENGEEITYDIGGGVHRQLIGYEIRWTNQIAVDSFDAHGAAGMQMRVNYEGQLSSQIKLGLHNPFYIDTNPELPVNTSGAMGDVGLEINKLSRKDWYYAPHRTFGIPKFYTNFGDTVSPVPGNRYQIVYFVPILGDDDVKRPYRVPGADGMTIDQTRARISTLTNGTMVQRYDPTLDDNVSIDIARQPGTQQGDIEITGDLASPDANIFTMDHLPHLIVFVEPNSMPAAVGDEFLPDRAWVPQVEQYAHAGGRGPIQPQTYLKTMAWDFLESYWEDDGTPRYYPNEWSVTNFRQASGQAIPQESYITLKENANRNNNPSSTRNGLALDGYGMLQHSIVRSF